MVKSINQEQFIIWLKELKLLLNSKISFIQVLYILVDSTVNKKLKNLSKNILLQMSNGSRFSQALETSHYKIDPIFISLVIVGEQNDNIPNSLKDYIDFKQNEFEFKKKQERALLYPMFVLIVSTIILYFLMVLLIPQFIDLLSTNSQKLPLGTQLLFSISQKMQNSLILSFLLLALLNLFIYVIFSKGYIWYIIPLTRKHRHLQFNYFFSLLCSLSLNNNLDYLQTLSIVYNSFKSKKVKKQLKKSMALIMNGDSFHLALKELKTLDRTLLQIIQATENFNTLPEALKEVSYIYQSKLEDSQQKILKIFEPILLMFIALLMGSIIISLYIPIFTLSSEFNF